VEAEAEAESEGRWWRRGGSCESGGGEAAAWFIGSARGWRVRYPLATITFHFFCCRISQNVNKLVIIIYLS
jgi:hypothetical protein